VPSPSWRLYAAVQGVAIVAFLFAPLIGWTHYLWQAGVGWLGAVVVAAGARHSTGTVARVWYLVAIGLFLNASGLMAVAVRELVFHRTDTPNVADFLFLGLYPGLLGGLGTLVVRRSTSDDMTLTLTSTVMAAVLTTGVGLIVWELVIWNDAADHGITLLDRALATAYPLADLMVVALTVRLMLGGAARSAGFRLLLLSLVCFLGADVGWATVLKGGGAIPDSIRRVLEMSSMTGFALMGLAAVHPAGRDLAFAHTEPRPGRAKLGWAVLVLALLPAPAVLLIEALLDHVYDLGRR
jgi:hypothetical protein